MALTHMRLTEITTIAATAGAVYTNPASTTAYVTLIVLHNTNTTAEDVELWNVPDSTGSVGTAADTNKFWADSLAANETVFVEVPKIGLVLEDTNDTIQAMTDTASKVTIQIFGSQEA